MKKNTVKRVKKQTAKTSRIRRGSDHPFSKFTLKQRRRIINAYDKGASQGLLAHQFDVTQSCISHIVRNQRWVLDT
jgi:CENP-B N-terminal DNA-binding domain